MIGIRNYTTLDKPEILNLLRLNTPRFFASIEEQELIEFLDYKIDFYFVVTLDKEVVACGGFNRCEDIDLVRISWDMVHPHYHHQGIGRNLMVYRIQKIKEHTHLSTIQVRTSQHTFQFYQKLGFELKEVVPDYWAEGFDLYRMEKLNKLN